MDKFFIQMNISVLKFYFHLKDDNNYVGGLYIKIHFYMFIKTLDEIKEKLPPKYTKKYTFFYLKRPPCSVLSPNNLIIQI